MSRELGNPITLGRIVNTTDAPPMLMASDQRSTHLHVVGNTGSGKSKFLEHLIRQDIIANRATNCGMLVIDPHGPLYDSIMTWMALVGLDRPIVPINLAREQWIVAYNVLRKRQRASASVVVDAMIDAMAHVWGAANTDQTPKFARWASNMLHVLYEKRYTLADAVHLLTNQAELREAMTRGISDDMARRDWEMVRTFRPREFEDEVSSTVSRLRRFVSNSHMRSIFGQPDKSFDFGAALEQGHIVLVNLSQEGGTISEENARLFGTLLLNDLWTAAKERGKRDDVKPFYVYVDEFQQFLTPTIADNLDQSRGFGIHWTLSHQFPAQLRDAGENGKRVYQSVMENARSKVCFSLSTAENLEPMAQWLFTGVMNPDEIKHNLYSTKVMEYREEIKRSHSEGVTSSRGGTDHSSESRGESNGGSLSDNGALTESWNDQSSSTDGYTDSWSTSTTRSVTDTPTLVPILGKELSVITFRGLDEQLFRSMAALFDQEQRRCVARLRGMKTPVSLFTPFVKKPLIRAERVEEHMETLYKKLAFALPGADARAAVEEYRESFAKKVINEACSMTENDEPTTARRRIR
jgi:hypothetical protein